jgi:ABC-2 type transport system permease protein
VEVTLDGPADDAVTSARAVGCHAEARGATLHAYSERGGEAIPAHRGARRGAHRDQHPPDEPEPSNIHLHDREEARLTSPVRRGGPHSVAAAGSAAPISAASVFGALLRRDLRVARRELGPFLVRTLMQPLLFVVVFGFLMPRMGFVRGGYTTALLPGIIAVGLTMSSMQAVSFPMIQDFGWTREIEDRLLAPVPISLIAVEKVVAGALQGVVAALVVLPLARLIMGPIPGLTLAHAGWLLPLMALGALAFAAFGLWIGTTINPQQIGLMFSIIIAPMMMFGCAYYPWASLDAVPAMKYGVLVNPLVYVSEAMRGALTPELPHMPLVASAPALAVLVVLFLSLGVRSFRKRALS